MTTEEMAVLKDDLFKRIRTALDQFIGGHLTDSKLDQIRARTQQVIQGWTLDTGISKDLLGFQFDITLANDNSVHFNLQPTGLLAHQFVDAATSGTSPVDPDERSGLRGFNPLWGGQVELDRAPQSEGVPPVEKPRKIWFDGSDPFLRAEE